MDEVEYNEKVQISRIHPLCLPIRTQNFFPEKIAELTWPKRFILKKERGPKAFGFGLCAFNYRE